MELIKLLGVLIVIVGFALKLDSILIIFLALITTGIVGGLGVGGLLETIGTNFVANRSMAIFMMILLVTGTLERNGLREAAANLIKKVKSATAGKLIAVYGVLNGLFGAFNVGFGGVAGFIRPVLLPMAEGAIENKEGTVNEEHLEEVKGLAAAMQNFTWFFFQVLFVGGAGGILVQTTLAGLGYEVSLVPAAFNTAGLNIVWILVGLIAIYAGIKNLLDEENPSRIGTAIFWCSFGIVTALGTWLPAKVSGVLVIIMCLPPIFKKVKVGKTNAPEKAHTEAQFKKIGMKIFVPAFCVAVFSLAFSLFSNMSSMIAITLGVLVAIIFLVAYDSKENKPQVFLKDSERFLSLTGPLSMLPQLLGCLGGVFTAAGVGEVIAQIVEKVVPKGNVNIGIIVYAVGMVLFTMIMGNAFAAITVMTVGIGAPFVLAYGANPVVIGMTALTCGYCGTLMTPMAANFNIVPVAILNMKDRWGVIKNQVLVGLIMLVFQICYMIVLK